MMHDAQFQIKSWIQLGKLMSYFASSEPWPGFESGVSEDEFKQFNQIINTHHHYNGWFTENNIRKALFAWSELLTADKMLQWLGNYQFPDLGPSRKVGIICAGNLPIVGFHDVVTVLLAGHKAYIKCSSDDNMLMPALLQLLVKFDPGLASRILFADGRMNDMEAVLATGSNNTSRYFEQYFGHLPHIIRKSRTSVAILDGDERQEDLELLGNDIFDYFGLGCRNVSKIYLPQGYPIDRFFRAIFKFQDVIHHNKYANNYDYNKAVWLLNNERLLDNGFLLVKEDTGLHAPTGSVFIEYYDDQAELAAGLAARAQEIQCVVSKGNVAFGRSQQPAWMDYADGVDTMRFLLGLKE